MANPNSPWTYVWEGLLSGGNLRLRFGGLFLAGLILLEGLLSEFYGIVENVKLERKEWGNGMKHFSDMA